MKTPAEKALRRTEKEQTKLASRSKDARVIDEASCNYHDARAARQALRDARRGRR